MADDYAAWLDEHLGNWIRHQIQLDPPVATRYQAAFQGDPAGQQWMASVASPVPASDEPALADLPFAEVPDGELQEAVTGIAPADASPALAAELDELAAFMTDEEKAAFDGLSADEIQTALDEARAELAEELAADDGADASAPGATSTDGPDGPAAEEPAPGDLPFADVPDGELQEAVTGIAPADASPALTAELDELAAFMTDEEKAAFAGLSADEIQTALDEARAELAEEQSAGDGADASAPGPTSTDGPDGPAEPDPAPADLPFADVPDGELQEAVTGIAPADASPALAAELNELAAFMTDEEKAAFDGLSAEEIQTALNQARAELAA